MTIDKANLLIGIVALLVGILLGSWAVRSGWEIAEATGSLKKSDLRVSLAGTQLSSQDSTHLFVGVPLGKERSAVVYLPLVLANLGDRSARNVAVTIRFPATVRRGVREAMSTSMHSTNQTNKAALELSSAGNFEFATYSIDRVDPGTAFQSSEPLVLSETSIETEALTKDNVPIKVVTSYSYLIQVTVSGEDQAPIDHTVSLEVINTEEKEALVLTAVDRAFKRRERTRGEMSWWKYLRVVASTDASTSYQAVFAPVEERTFQGGSYLEGTRELATVGPLVIPDYSWWLVFK